MKVFLKKELLQYAIGLVEKNIGRNTTLPILNNILIKAENGRIQFIATNLELATIVEIPTKIEKEGSIALQPKVLSGFLQNTPEGIVELTQEKSTLAVKVNETNTSLKGQDTRDYPILPKIKKSTSFTLPTTEITKAFGQVINSVATSDLKPELTGVLLYAEKNELHLAATDSFRLSEKRIQREGLGPIKKFIIPPKTAQEIVRNYQNISGGLTFEVDFENHQLFIENTELKNVRVQLISKLIEGEYPEYTQIIPKEYKTKTIATKQALGQQVRAAGLFASRVNDVRITLAPKKIELKAENYDVGDFQSAFEAATEGDQQEVVFNYLYLLDGLNNIDGDEVVLKVNRPDGPALLESTKDKDYFYLLMPIRR